MAATFADVLGQLEREIDPAGGFRSAASDVCALTAVLFAPAPAAQLDVVARGYGSDAPLEEPVSRMPTLESICATINTGGVSAAELKRLRRVYAMLCHPDRHAHNGEREQSTHLMSEVNALIDAALRTKNI